MGRSESIVYEYVAMARQFFREIGIIPRFFFIVPQVLKQQNFSLPKFFNRRLRRLPDAVLHEARLFSEESAQHRNARLQRHFRDPFTFRSPQVGHQDQLPAIVHDIFNRGRRRPDPFVVGHHASLQGNVEIDAHENPFASHIHIFNRKFVHECPLLLFSLKKFIRLFVEESCSSSTSPSASSSGNILPARTLPSSTPHWSKE